MDVVHLRRLAMACAAVLMAAHGSAVAAGARYELYPDPVITWSLDHRASTAYVIDKQANQFWECTARYSYESERDNNGSCDLLPTGIGRPSVTPAHDVRAIVGSPLISADLPVFWFIEPMSGDIQFCAVRRPGVCVRMTLPQRKNK
jgi:hypothetical protein